MEHWVAAWSLVNVCTLYRPQPHRRHHEVGLQFVSREGVVGIIHAFSEYKFGFVRLATVRAAAEYEKSELDRCPRQRLGFAVPFSANNLYHALHHGVPALRSFQSYLDANGSIPDSALLIPLIASSAGVGGRKIRRGSYNWVAWELTVRALTRRSAGVLANETRLLTNTTGCTCFDVVHGNTAPFTPSAPSSVSLLHTFRNRAMRHARALLRGEHDALFASPSFFHAASTASEAARAVRRLLYIRRSRSRVLVNEAQLIARLGDLVYPVALETLPLSAQLVLVSEQVHSFA